MESVTVHKGILHYVQKNSANCELYTSFFGQHLEIYIYIKYTASCISTQQDVIHVIEFAKTSASLWVCVHKQGECKNGSQYVSYFLPKVHSTVYSAEPVSIVNRLSLSENQAAAAMKLSTC